MHMAVNNVQTERVIRLLSKIVLFFEICLTTANLFQIESKVKKIYTMNLFREISKGKPFYTTAMHLCDACEQSICDVRRCKCAGTKTY